MISRQTLTGGRLVERWAESGGVGMYLHGYGRDTIEALHNLVAAEQAFASDPEGCWERAREWRLALQERSEQLRKARVPG